MPRKRGRPVTKRGRLRSCFLCETIHEAVDLDRGDTRFDDLLDLTEDLAGQTTRRTHTLGEAFLGVSREVAIPGLAFLDIHSSYSQEPVVMLQAPATQEPFNSPVQTASSTPTPDAQPAAVSQHDAAGGAGAGQAIKTKVAAIRASTM
jgi:hypothetical protein